MAGLWYRVGTISVTNGSKKVTGFGTQFKTGTYKPDKGHTFWGPDGKHYEVDYVESDTVLYLVQAYTGATAAGQSYEIDITRTGTTPALSREVSAMLAYAQGQYDSWQQILTGSGNVSLFAPDGQSVTVPALSNMLSKSGNLAGLADKPTARGNLELGDAATKNVGVAAGSVAAGDHIHESIITVGGDPDKYYPVALSGNGLINGASIGRSVHQNGTWLGALRLDIGGIGAGWGGETPYIDYEFSQMWGGGVTTSGCLADVSVSGAGIGVYVWLRGGRQYFLNGQNVSATVYLSGVTEADGSSFTVRSTGTLVGLGSGASLDGPQLYRGPIANNKPYWNGENLPITSGTWAPYFDNGSVTVTHASWRKIGDICTFKCHVNLTNFTGSGYELLVLRGLPFSSSTGFSVTSVYASSLLSGLPVATERSMDVVGLVTGNTIEFYRMTSNGVRQIVSQSEVRPQVNGTVVLIISGTYQTA